MSKSYVAHCMSGVYCYDRFVTVGHCLRNHPYSQCGYDILDDGTIQFISYETIVCEISPDGWFNLRGEFSTTTSKQITWFLDEFKRYLAPCAISNHVCRYGFLRDYYRKGRDYNLYTDETRDYLNGMIQTVGIKTRV